MLQQPQHQLFDKNSPLRSSLRKHRVDANGKQQRSPSGRKTVSFCSSQNAENKRLLVSNVADCFALMQAGTELIKLRTNVRQFRRIFSLDADMAYIRWTPSNKKPHKARISIDSIKEVRVGWNSELLRLTEPIVSPEINEECAFSIIHGDEHECLDLIALNASDANIWITGLIALASEGVPSIRGRDVVGGSLYSSPANLRERWLSSSFKEIDQDIKGYISEKSAVRLIHSLNNRLLISRIKQKVKEASNLNEIQKGRIDETHFIDVYKDLATRPEIYFLMVRYANKDYLNINDLQLFLETEQGLSGITTQFCEDLIDQCEPSNEARELNIMTVDGFSNFLHSQTNSVFDPLHLNVCQNMEKPFSNYFISTSFNTYLVEDQLRGPSSLDGYTSALKRNCRYIELDIWEPDDGGGDEPVLFNGGTLTSKLSLGPVLDLINEMAFERTRYPLFIRLELHLHSIDWQHKLLNLLELKLGSRLYRPLNDSTDWSKELPTPKKFLNKIILSGPYYEGNAPIGEVEEEDESSELLLLTENNLQNEQTQKTKKRLMPLLREIRDLIAPFAIFGRINECGDLNKYSPSHNIISISESDCIRLAHSQPNFLFSSPPSLSSQENINLNSSNSLRLIRVFPSPQRIDSSNLNPQEFWNFGCQFVALNYQTPGLMMDLQEGKFLANGSCGYVLKPSIMIEENSSSSTELINNGTINNLEQSKKLSLNQHQSLNNNNNLRSTQQILHLKVLSGQQLPRPRASTAKGDTGLDPFVVLEVFGVPADCAEERTKTVRSSDDDNCFNPTFDESFQFSVSVPELALIRFLVLDDDFIGDDFIGQYTIPFDCLQSGYRHIPLLNNEGEPMEASTLFVHIAVTNKRGGGKPKKRGLSVKRKTSRVQTGMKIIGIKQIDELFKSASGPLAQFIELKAGMELAMTVWAEESGIGVKGTLAQSIVKLHSRASKEISTTDSLNNSSSSLFIINKKIENKIEILQLNITNNLNVPDPLQKAFSALDNLLKQCSDINLKSNSLYISLNESSKLISEYELGLQKIIFDAGLRGQKATRAQENFGWNVRLLKAQLGLMQETFSDAKQVLEQVSESGRVLNILREGEKENKEEGGD
uniref:Phosphoinositide phospholipase C n=1 Tax=Meloidogyne enterolobii TaxID=390850 RepID=A0A6V7TVQ8_MELEN|nr:unnamed protein product [Meloidogyne enterolobii]